MKSYFSQSGIIHESSCVDMPQQNGLAERRMGYILATARSLLFQANLLKKYWGEAVLTAAHLINRIPMKVINYDTPLSRLKESFPRIKLFTGLPARVFGCVAFVHQELENSIPEGSAAYLSGTQVPRRDIDVTIFLPENSLFQLMLCLMRMRCTVHLN